jgi:hypothetical protein
MEGVLLQSRPATSKGKAKKSNNREEESHLHHREWIKITLGGFIELAS